ncbi:MAG: ABC transporter permease [Thermomicrobiales bacterium]
MIDLQPSSQRPFPPEAGRFDPPPVRGWPYLANIIPVLMRRQAQLWLQFRVSSVMDILTMLAQASVFFFVGRAIGGETWTAATAGFLAVGIVINTFLQQALTGPYHSIADAYWSMRLESLMFSPCPLIVNVIGDVLWILVNATISAMFLVGIGAAFGARLSASAGDLLLAAGVLILGTLAVLGIGLISASMFMLINAKGFNDPISWLVGVLQGLVAGAYFPPSELPGPLYAVARCLPQTYTIDAIRRLLLHDHPAPLARIGTLSPLASDVLIVAVMTLGSLALGASAFRAGIRKAQRDGGLSRWS